MDLMRPGGAEGVARLFRTVYGQGYPIRTYLEPERLKEENDAGRTLNLDCKNLPPEAFYANQLGSPISKKMGIRG